MEEWFKMLEEDTKYQTVSICYWHDSENKEQKNDTEEKKRKGGIWNGITINQSKGTSYNRIL